MELDDNALYQISRNGEQFGPVAGSQLLQLIATQQLLPGDLLWKDGMGNWLPATEFTGLTQEFNRLAAQAAPSQVAPPASTHDQIESHPVHTAVDRSGGLHIDRTAVTGPRLVHANIRLTRRRFIPS